MNHHLLKQPAAHFFETLSQHLCADNDKGNENLKQYPAEVQTKYSRMQGLQPQHHNGMK
jgi:hypothetical protein